MQIRSFISTSFFRIVAVSLVLAVLPLVCVLAVVGFMRVQQSYERFAENTAQFMRTVADKQSEMDLTTRTLLDSVSRAREFSGREFSDAASVEAARRLFKRLHASLALYSDLALYDRSGKLITSSMDSSSPVPSAAPPAWRLWAPNCPLPEPGSTPCWAAAS